MWRGFVHQTTFKDIKELDKQKRVFYFGVDANSAPSATIGNLAAMMMVKNFIKHGNSPILLVGGATGRIGDPKDDAERPDVSGEVVELNKQGIVAQYKQVFGDAKLKVVDNYDWFKNIGYVEFLQTVGKKMSMSQLLDREFVKNRVGEGGSGLSYAEFSYSLMQGYDFLHLFRAEDVTLQICGSDQWGNSLAGVEMIRKLEGQEAHVWSCPLIINQSTGKKFGKSEDGAVWLDKNKTSVFKFYQFWLNLDDEGVGDYIKIYTEIMPEELAKLMAEFERDPAGRAAQKFLAYEVTKTVHGQQEAENVKRITEVLFGSGNGEVTKLKSSDFEVLKEELPSSSQEDLLEFLVETNLVKSKSEARRFVEQGAISVNGDKVADVGVKLKASSLIKKGKNGFAIRI
jgi:tyrosyl-tRNA synthetase